MNTPIFTCVKSCTKNRSVRGAALIAVALLLSFDSASAEWKVDFSRRAKAARETDLNAAGFASDRSPASMSAPVVQAPSVDAVPEDAKKGLFDTIFDAGEPVQDLVIMHTDKGFVPATVRVRKNGRYRIHVVNVNEKEKNVSFILDGFSEHHATYYGKIKTFALEPKKEGAFSFQSPETSSEGRLVVFNPQITVRNPASEEPAK